MSDEILLGRAKISPFLKWAGGKRWLVTRGVPQPKEFYRLVEPFAGSAAVFFAFRPTRALLADANPELINLYKVVRDQPIELRKLLEKHQSVHSPHHYYGVRSQIPKSDVESAARMLYLNRTCWNGLYRVNKAGRFNVPIGTKTTVIGDDEDFLLHSSVLKSARIVCQDFETTIDSTGGGDFLFVDPPYTVKHNMNGFVKYNENMFSWDDQVRLVAALRRASGRGAKITVTNADHESVRALYEVGFAYESVARQSILAAHSSYRGKTTEAIFTV